MSSLDKEAIQHIEGMSKAGKPVEEADFKAVYLPDSMKIQDLEHLQKFKNRYTGDFITDSLASFAEYVKEQDEKTCFVHTKRPVAKAIFDLGTKEEPLHAKHNALFEVGETAAYMAVKSFAQGRQSQEDLAEWLEDWMFCIQVLDKDNQEMDVRTAIRAVRNVTIEAAGKYESDIQQLSTTQSSLESIEANSKGNPLPAWINFTCRPYKCIEEATFPIRISMSLKKEEIAFLLKISNLEKIQEDISEHFAETVSNAIGKDTAIYLGEFSVDNRHDYSRRL